jgi:predicted secreted protein
MFSKINSLALVAVVGLAFAGCGEVAQNEDLGDEAALEGGKADLVGDSLLVIDENSDGKVIKARVGVTVEVRLPGNPTTGYAWKCLSYSKSLPLADESFEPSQPQTVGSGGTFSFFFLPDLFAAGGAHVVKFAYFRSWEGEASASKTFSVTLKVAAAAQNIVVDSTMTGKTVKANVGDTVEVRLPGNPTTGYQWECLNPSKSLPLADEAYTADLPQLTGSGGTYSFFFKPDGFAHGKSFTIRFAYFRSWEGQAAAIENFSITLKVAP